MTIATATITGQFLGPDLTGGHTMSATYEAYAEGTVVTYTGLGVIGGRKAIPIQSDGTATLTLPTIPQAGLLPSSGVQWHVQVKVRGATLDYYFDLSADTTWDAVLTPGNAAAPPGLIAEAQAARDAAETAAASVTVYAPNSKARFGSPPVASFADVDRFIAPRGTQQSITTYVGTEVVEPSVWYDPNGLFGYEFWMAAGPYENSSSAVEQPSIWCSHDGQTWIIPPGGSNPVVVAPGSGNYDDPHIFEFAGTLHLVWNYTRAGSNGDQVLYSSTTDGITWSTPVAIRTSASTSHGEYVSPHIEYQDGLWYMWTLNNIGTRTMYLSTATSLTGTWSAPAACTAPLPTGKDLWEFEVRRVGSEWWMLQTCVTTGNTAAGGELRFRTSRDGLTWNMSTRPVLTGSAVSGAFDENFIYKASFVPLLDGRMAIWYSAGSGGTLRWKIGYTIAEGPSRNDMSPALWYAPPCSVGTGAGVQGTVYFLPIYFDKAKTLSGLGLEVTTAGSAGSVINLGLYASDNKGMPGARLVDAGSIDGTTTGVKTLTINQSVGPGIVWLAAVPLGSPTTNPTIRMATSTVLPIGTTTTLASQNTISGHRQVSQTSLPATAVVNTNNATSNVARVIYQSA